MKKYICMILAVVMIAATLAACGSNETKKVATDGSTSMEKMIGALGEAFMENTGATFTYNPTGSGTGIKAVKDRQNSSASTTIIGMTNRFGHIGTCGS